MKMQGFILFS